MGAGSVSGLFSGFMTRRFKRDDEIFGRGKDVLIMGKQMNLKNNDVDRIFHEYTKFEDGHKLFQSDENIYKVDLQYFLKKIKCPSCIFLEIIFQLFDKKKTGLLPFLEFMIIIWTFLSSDYDILAILCFNLMDSERFVKIMIVLRFLASC